jgi:hypothetical protein
MVNLWEFGHAHPAEVCLLFLFIWVSVSIIALWPFSRSRVLARLPLVICASAILLPAALNALPEAIPRVFERMLGHSVSALHTTKEASGTLLSEPWIETWRDSNDTVGLCCAGVAFAWAIVNLFKRQAWLANGLVVAYTIWALFSAFFHASPL